MTTSLDTVVIGGGAMGSAAAQERVLHAWKAGPQTAQLRR